MGAESIRSLLTLLGVLITVFVSYQITIRRITAEIHKTNQGTLAIYAEYLGKARIDSYPELFGILSTLVKAIDYHPDLGNPDLALIDAFSKINEWDSRHGLLLAHESGKRCFSLRLILRDIIRAGYHSLGPFISDQCRKTDLENALVGLEVALRKDLGVYALEEWNIEPSFRTYEARTFPGRDSVGEKRA
jgi:hypothetical protein